MTVFGRWIGRGLAGLALVAGVSGQVLAQGVTTGAVSGVIVDSASVTPLEGATVTLKNTQTGFTLKATTAANGRYNFQNLETGPGYVISVVSIGYRPESVADIRVTLTQATRVDVLLAKQVAKLDELVSTAPLTEGEISPTRQGAQTIVSDTMIRRLPSLNRRLSDVVRTSPNVIQGAGNGSALNAAGQNSRFNNIQIDGTSANDRFGLGSTGELGGQAGGRGITPEAIKEVQIVLSPYNVNQGNFTGALINGVTKNGTNEFTGSLFGTFRNQKLAANDPFIRGTPFSRYQYGGSVGGPIVKDKIFFFLAAEGQKASTPATGAYTGGTGSQATVITQAQIDSFKTGLRNYGLANPGTDSAIALTNPLFNSVARLDFVLSPTTRLVVRDIYNRSTQDVFSRGSTFGLTSSLYKAKENNNTAGLQLFSNFANGSSNEFELSWNRIRFLRQTPQVFPFITVNGVSNTVNGATVSNSFVGGTENSSQGNFLNQDLIELRNDYTFGINQRTQSHLITIGTRNEAYKVQNGFLQNSYGNFTFSNLTNFVNGVPTQYRVGVGRGADSIANFWAASFSTYIQDQWRPADNFNMTVGLRFEAPGFFSRPGITPQVYSDFGRLTNQLPNWNLMVQPRLGFNWDATRDQKNQVRGGLGVFAGAPAYVWLSNNFSNSGQGLAQITCSAAGTIPQLTAATAANRPAGCIGGTASTTIGTINTVAPGLTFPQIMRGSLAYDRALPLGIVGSVEGIFTRGISSFFYQNLNLKGPQSVGIGGRTIYGTFGANGAGIPTTVNSTYGGVNGGVIDLSNQGNDYAYSISGALRKRFGSSFEFTGAYTYGHSYSVQDLTSSVAASNYQFGRTYSGLQSSKVVGVSLFDVPNRIVISGTYTAPWKKFPTDITLFYVGQSGTPFTYVAFGTASGQGDLNADGYNTNDPIYVPRSTANAAEIQFADITKTTGGVTTVVTSAATQAAAFQQFIDGSKCLSQQKGQILARNTCRNPWFNQMDIAVRQTLPKIFGQQLTLQAEMFNFLNFIKSDWGQVKGAVQANNGLASLTSNPSLLQQVGQGANGPIFNFNTALVGNQFAAVSNVSNFWQAQFTVRYSF